MSVQAITSFCQHLDNAIREECGEDKIQIIAGQCFPDHRMACEVTICQTIVARLEKEFETELSKEVWKTVSKNRIESLKTDYCISKATRAADEATEKAWKTLEANPVKHKSNKNAIRTLFSSLMAK